MCLRLFVFAHVCVCVCGVGGGVAQCVLRLLELFEMVLNGHLGLRALGI